MKTLAAATTALFDDPEIAGDAVVELVRIGTTPHALLVGMHDVRAQHAFAERYGIGELRHPHAGRSALAMTLDRLTALDGERTDVSFADALVGAGIASDTAEAADRALVDGGVLLLVPAAAPADALGVLLRHRADLGTGVLEEVIPLREELLHVEKHAVTEHEVVVRTEVISEIRTFEVPLEREELVIERRRPLADGTMGEPEEMRIPLQHEEVQLTKQTILTAEVDVRKERSVDVAHVSETVRHEELRVEADPDVPVAYGEGL